MNVAHRVPSMKHVSYEVHKSWGTDFISDRFTLCMRQHMTHCQSVSALGRVNDFGFINYI